MIKLYHTFTQRILMTHIKNIYTIFNKEKSTINNNI